MPKTLLACLAAALAASCDGEDDDLPFLDVDQFRERYPEALCGFREQCDASGSTSYEECIADQTAAMSAAPECYSGTTGYECVVWYEENVTSGECPVAALRACNYFYWTEPCDAYRWD